MNNLFKLFTLIAFSAFVLNAAHKSRLTKEEKLHDYPDPMQRVETMGMLPEPNLEQAARARSTAGKTKSVKTANSYEQRFINELADVAVEESKLHNGAIPASLIIAQAILESNWGKSRLAKQANNYFGHKWRGKGGWILVNDDAPNERFTKYKSRWHSVRAHTTLLMGGLYKGRLKGEPTLENWLDALCGDSDSVESKRFVKKGGRVYATACYNSCYACKIRGIVEQWNLTKYDI